MTSLIGEQFDCSNSISCTQTHHEVASTRYHFNPNENPKFRIEYARNETEIYQYSKKVSTQGLIGQVGGIHGITLATLQRHLVVSWGRQAQPTTTLGRWRVASAMAHPAHPGTTGLFSII